MSEDRYVVVNGKGERVPIFVDGLVGARALATELTRTCGHKGPYSVMRVTLTPIEDDEPSQPST